MRVLHVTEYRHRKTKTIVLFSTMLPKLVNIFHV